MSIATILSGLQSKGIPFPWIRNTDGKPDAVLTFALAGFTVILAKFLFAGLHVVWGAHVDFTVVAPTSGEIAAVLLPTLGSYVSNKYVNLNFHPDYLKMRKDIDGDGKEEDVLVPKGQ